MFTRSPCVSKTNGLATRGCGVGRRPVITSLPHCWCAGALAHRRRSRSAVGPKAPTVGEATRRLIGRWFSVLRATPARWVHGYYFRWCHCWCACGSSGGGRAQRGRLPRPARDCYPATGVSYLLHPHPDRRHPDRGERWALCRGRPARRARYRGRSRRCCRGAAVAVHYPTAARRRGRPGLRRPGHLRRGDLRHRHPPATPAPPPHWSTLPPTSPTASSPSSPCTASSTPTPPTPTANSSSG